MKLVLLSTLAAAIPTSSAFVSTSTTSTIDNRQVVVLFGALHNVEAGVGARNSFGARFGDEYLSTGHWSESETSGTSAMNAMDGRDPSSTRVFQYTRSTTHGTSSANTMDGAGSTISHSTTHAKSNAHSTSWTPGQHADTGNSAYEWAGARFGDYSKISKAAAPTPSQWLE